MATNMPAPSALNPITPDQFITSLPEERRAVVRVLHAAIREAAPTLEPFMLNSMIGYGRYHYRYASGREGDWAVVALAIMKGHVGLYVCCTDADGRYLAEKHATRLGRVSVGRSCIRIKRLEHLDLPVAMELVREAAELLKNGSGSFQL